MLSILIPTFNYDTLPLVKSIHKQCVNSDIVFEILVFDDGSNSELNKYNKTINNIDHCTFKEFKTNRGRSAIRNLLAKTALYENLLFIDAGTFIKRNDFIKKYIECIDNQVTVGGMNCLPQKPPPPYTLRWKYTKLRESKRDILTACSSNFLIKKKKIKKFPFDESLKKYGCEDVLFFDCLRNNGINIKIINNPVIHDAKDNAITFIKKTENALENLDFLLRHQKISKNRYKVSLLYFKLNKIRIHYIISFIFLCLKPILKKNFSSSKPSLLLYDFYRFGYFCTLKIKR